MCDYGRGLRRLTEGGEARASGKRQGRQAAARAWEDECWRMHLRGSTVSAGRLLSRMKPWEL